MESSYKLDQFQDMHDNLRLRHSVNCDNHRRPGQDWVSKSPSVTKIRRVKTHNCYIIQVKKRTVYYESELITRKGNSEVG